MKQGISDLKDGRATVKGAPAPTAQEGRILSKTVVRLSCAGAERMLVDFGRSGWLQKALKHPEFSRCVIWASANERA